MEGRIQQFVALADSSAHGYGSGDVFRLFDNCGCVATTSGGSLLIGGQAGGDDPKPSIAAVVVRNWARVATMLGLEPKQFLAKKVVVGVIPGQDSVAGNEKYDELSQYRAHYGIKEGERTINSYNDWCKKKFRLPLYGTSGGKKLHFIGGQQQSQAVFCHICQQQAMESLREGKAQHNVLPLVICCGWNALSATNPSKNAVKYAKEQTVLHQEQQAVKSMQNSAKHWREILQILACFSGDNVGHYWDFWMNESGNTGPLWWLPKRRFVIDASFLHLTVVILG